MREWGKKIKKQSVDARVLGWKLWVEKPREAHPEERTLGCDAQFGSFIHLFIINWTNTERIENKELQTPVKMI